MSVPTNESPTDNPNHVGTNEIVQQSNASNNFLANIDLSNPSDLEKAKIVFGQIIASGRGGFKTVTDGIAILGRAKELNLPFFTCVDHVHVINGKTGIDVHVIKALLLRAGVTWECLNDYTPQYEYTDGFNVFNESLLPDYAVKCANRKEAEERSKGKKEEDDVIYVYPTLYYKDFNGNVYKNYQLTSNFVIALNQVHATEIHKSGKIPIFRIPNQPIDYICKYKFERNLKGKTITAIGKFSYTDAEKADMFTKDTYQKYPRVLISHRAFTYGAREIGGDILMGAYETTELKIVAGQPIKDSELDNNLSDIEEAVIIE